jgi:hypothetical protein
MTSERPASDVAAPPPTNATSFPALEIALLAFICFLPSIAAGFVYDDVILIRDNRYAHGLQHLGRAFTHFFWELEEGPRTDDDINYYRPLVTVSYVVSWAVANGSSTCATSSDMLPPATSRSFRCGVGPSTWASPFSAGSCLRCIRREPKA